MAYDDEQQYGDGSEGSTPTANAPMAQTPTATVGKDLDPATGVPIGRVGKEGYSHLPAAGAPAAAPGSGWDEDASNRGYANRQAAAAAASAATQRFSVAGSGGGGGAASTNPEDALYKELQDHFRDVYSGKMKRFSPELLQQMKDDVFRTTEGARNRSIDDAKRDAVRRGIFRSGIPTGAMLEAGAKASAEFSRGSTDINIQAEQADYQAKADALQSQRALLDSKWQHVAQMDKNSADRQAAEAQLRLGYARIASEEKMLGMSLAARGGGGGGGGAGNLPTIPSVPVF